VSVFDKRFHFRLLNDRRSLLSCGVFLCLVAIGENPAGSFAVAIRNRQTEILFLEFAPHVAPSPVDSPRNPCFAERALRHRGSPAACRISRACSASVLPSAHSCLPIFSLMNSCILQQQSLRRIAVLAKRLSGVGKVGGTAGKVAPQGDGPTGHTFTYVGTANTQISFVG